MVGKELAVSTSYNMWELKRCATAIKRIIGSILGFCKDNDGKENGNYYIGG